jgi:DNA-binding NarL/FixJ family response regulator
MLLAALSAFLPLVPEESRERAAEVLSVVGKALSVGSAVATNLDDLAAKLAAIRAEVEAMAGRQVTPEELDAAMNRVRAASSAFREALETAEAGAP